MKLNFPLEWFLIIAVIVAFVIYCDASLTDSNSIMPQSSAARIQWNYLEPPESRIRMLWIIHGYVPKVNAGSEICAHTLNKFFMEKPYKYDIWVATPGFSNMSYEGVRCFDLYDADLLTKLINSSQIIHSHSYIYRRQLKYICKKTRKPFIEWVHTDNYVRSIPDNGWLDKSIQDRHWTVFNSESLKQSRRDVAADQTYILNPVVDFRLYQIPADQKNPIYVTLSNVNDNKGGELLIKLARALPDFQFQGVMGGYRKQIVAHDLPNLRYIPNTTRIKDIYAQTWVLIMPSKEETWGRTAVEAMASGIPIVVAPTPGLRECCGDAAIYCNRDDAGEWISALQRLQKDKEYYNSRSALSYERARALDPNPNLEGIEMWLNDTVLAGAPKQTQNISSLENLLLFR